MRSERLLVWVSCLGVLVGCPEEKKGGAAPSRFAKVARWASSGKTAQFCDQSFPSAGDRQRKYQQAKTRAVRGALEAAAVGRGWRWVNAWATWCTPCIEEMGLLTRWRDALHRDGLDVSFELLSIDAPEAEPELRRWLEKSLPGQVQWIRSEDDFGLWLDGLGVQRESAIPIHALVDPQGQLRCVRVGAVHDQDFGSVRALLDGK